MELEGFDFTGVTGLGHTRDLENDERQIRLLGAGELAASRRTLAKPLASSGTVVVTPSDWDWACTYYGCCLGEMPNCAGKPTVVSLWDITVFPGHMKKLALLGYEEPTYLANHFDQAVNDMTEYLIRYDEGKRIVESGALALQAKTWRRRLELFHVAGDFDEIRAERDILGIGVHHFYGVAVPEIAVVGRGRYRIQLDDVAESAPDHLEFGAKSLTTFLAPIPADERNNIKTRVASTEKGASVSLGTMRLDRVVARALADPASDGETVLPVEVLSAKLNSREFTG